MYRLIPFLLLPALCSSSLAISPEARDVGPQACPSDKSILGYSSIEALNNDMVFNSLSTSNITNYILCPHTNYDMSSEVMPILPTQNNSKIQCGVHGISKDMCIFTGGKYQIYFHHQIVTENVEFHGLIFKNANRTSVGAYSNSHSSVKFVDCQWTENEAIMLVEVFHKEKSKSSGNKNLRVRRTLTQTDLQKEQEFDDNEFISYFQKIEKIDTALSNRRRDTSTSTNSTKSIHSAYNKGMNLTMEQCSFFGNNKAITLISTFGGFIELDDCLFLGNNAAAITIGIASYGTLSLKGTTFRMNTNQFSTIFIDPTSSVVTKFNINDHAFAMSGIGNTGNICQDIFIEDYGSNCLGNGGYTDECSGTCCFFSDAACVVEQESVHTVIPATLEEGDDSMINSASGNTSTVFNDTLFNSTW